MSTLSRAAAAAAIALLGVAWQDQPTDPFAGVEPGNRVTIRLRNGHRFAGQVLFVHGNRLTLDVSLDYPGVTGTITFRRVDVAAVESAAALSPEEIRRRLEVKFQTNAELEQAAADNRRRTEEWLTDRDRGTLENQLASLQEQIQGTEDETARAALQAQAEQMQNELNRQQGAQIYGEFPPPEWSEDRYQQIQLRLSADLPVSEPETRFYQNFELWRMGRDLATLGPPPGP